MNGERLTGRVDEAAHPSPEGLVVPDIESGEEPEQAAAEELLRVLLDVARRIDRGPESGRS